MKSEKKTQKKPLLIVNPKSGIMPVNYIVSFGLDFLKENFSIAKSLSKEDTVEIIDRNFDSHDVFVAAGGDGTVHSVAMQLVDTDKTFGVLPLGSGNGFAKEFGFNINVISLMSSIRKAGVMPIDVIELNGNLCLNVAGIGLDSIVAHSFSDLKLRGIFPYIWLTLKTFIRLKPFPVTIWCGDEKIVSEDIFVITIANTRQFGNNAFIAPDARPNDGVINLVLIKPFPKIFAPLFVIRLFTKQINSSKFVRQIKIDREITIETTETRMHIDGEPIKTGNRIVVKIKKESLKVLKTSRNKFIKYSN